jgi:quercetin dioxygenase-like cupin family protein
MAFTARQTAVGAVMIDDDRVKVTRWDFAPGAETGWHRHGMDYVVMTITPCIFLLEEPGGETRTVEMEAGVAYRRDEGVQHNVVNGGAEPMAFVEVELK